MKKMKVKRLSNRITSVVVSLVLIATTLLGCERNIPQNASPTSNEQNLLGVNVSVIDKSNESTETESEDKKNDTLKELVNSTDANIKSMVSSAVAYDLNEKGYETVECIAFGNDNNYNATGIGYYDPELQFFSDTKYAGRGFVSIIGPEDEYVSAPDDSEYIAVEPIEGTFGDDAEFNLLAYTCESLDYNHLVYENQYIVYYQLDSTTVKYECFENEKSNYDLSIGSLYDFDNDTYIYDASLFDGYEKHSGVELFSKEDYEKLEAELQRISKEQEQNGYYVEELDIVYISPESIEAYLASDEEDTFFGYSVKELESSLGKGTVLVYTGEGIETAQYYNEQLENYDWKSFLAKVSIGCGIILICAVLTPVTGGASFGCALLTITSMTLGAAFTQGLGTLAIETVTNMMNGDDIQTAIKNSSCKGLDAFANGFLIGAAFSSVGTVTGLIKPVACFEAGTLVAVPSNIPNIDYKLVKIEEINIGDSIISFDSSKDVLNIGRVSDVIVSETYCVIELQVGDNNTIRTTEEHPFYCPLTNNWIPAGLLNPGDKVLDINGNLLEITSVNKRDCREIVYNLSVDNGHTYFVGKTPVLVHNECSAVKKARKEGVRKAWAKEQKATMTGKSKYNWTKKELDELLSRGKIAGYDGCHIVDVQANPALASNPDNIIFLKREVHINVVHGGNTNNLSHWGEIIKIMPQFRSQVLKIGGLM